MSDDEKGTDRLVALLGEAGYQAERIDPTVIQSSFSGTSVYVQWYDSGSIQFIAGWSEAPEEFDLEKVNDFNSTYRFGSVFVEDGSVTLQANFFFDPQADNAEELLRKAIQVFEGLILQLLSKMKDAAIEEGAEPSAE